MASGTSKKVPVKQRILLADDEPAVRHAYAMLLSIDDHQVAEASNGTEAFELYQQQSFDVVITDYQMPLMKGNELASRIKKLKPSQPIIMITAFEPPQNSENPVDVVVHKPFTLEQLRQAIVTAMKL
jgi:CheY-like chemotaxis protein